MFLSLQRGENKRFGRQPQTIKVTNFDDKMQSISEKKIRKHRNMLSIFIRGIICGPSNCDKMNVLISLLENPHGKSVRFKNVYVYSNSLQ